MASAFSNLILIKRSEISGKIPNVSDLSLGEIALNTADGIIFTTKTQNDGLSSIVSFRNSEQEPFSLVEDLSSVNSKYGGNTVSQIFASVLGGYNNDISGGGSSVVNGEDNDIDSDFSFIGSGYKNKISATGDYSSILGGANNLISHENSFVLGSNLSSHAANFTYVNNLSGALWGDGTNIKNVSGVPIGNAGGDLYGTYPNPTIKDSVALYGQPTAPTAAAGTNTKQIATTEFVQNNKGDTYFTTSTSTNTIDNIDGKTFVLASSALSYTPTQDVTITWDGDPFNYHMHCTVVSYVGYNLVVNVNNHTGNGTHSNWTINVGGFTSQSGVLLQSNNLSDVASASTSLTNLGGVSTSRYLSAGNGLTGGGDLTNDRTFSVVFGNTARTVVEGNDLRLSDARTPLLHKSTHAIGGTDYLSPSDIGAVSSTTLQGLSGNWQNNSTTVQSNSSNWQTAYSYVSSNSINLTATNIFVNNNLTVTNTVSSKYYQGTLLDWMTLVRGYKTVPTLLQTIAGGDVYTYVFETTGTDKTYYRYIANDGSEDSFYGNFTGGTLSNLIARKAIIL